MPTTLKNLRLKRVSLVDNPANAEATVVLFKSAEEEPPMTTTKDMDDVAARAKAKKALDDADDEAEKGMCSKCMKSMGKSAAFCPNCGAKAGVAKEAGMELDKSKLEPEVLKHFERLEADLAAANEKLATVTKKAETEEDVLKGLPPAVRAIVEKSREQAADALAKVALLGETLEKREDEAIEKAFVEECKGLANIAGDPKVLGPILKRVSQAKTTADDLAKLREILKAANAAAKPTLRVVGSGEEKGGDGSVTAQAELETLAKQIIEKAAGDKKPSFADAMDIVVKERPDLWKRYQTEAMKTTVAVNEEE